MNSGSAESGSALLNKRPGTSGGHLQLVLQRPCRSPFIQKISESEYTNHMHCVFVGTGLSAGRTYERMLPPCVSDEAI